MICPPFATTTVPDCEPARVITTWSKLEVFTFEGSIWLFWLSYTTTIMFLLLKLCVTVTVDWFVKVSATVAAASTVILVMLEPSPLNEPVNEPLIVPSPDTFR